MSESIDIEFSDSDLTSRKPDESLSKAEREKTELPLLIAKYPSIDIAYPLAVDSYEVMSKRIEVVNQRLQNLAKFMLTFVALLPVALRTQDISLGSFWFICSMLALVTGVFLSVIPLLTGHIQLMHPRNLWDYYLDSQPLIVKRDLIAYAAEDYELNEKLLNRQHLWLRLSLIAFAVAAGLLVVWAVVGNS